MAFLKIRGFLASEILQVPKCNYFIVRNKMIIDKTRVPELNEKDLEEHFIKGFGPGGSKINKTNSCVYLVHKPTGISVKCQADRLRERNRKIARELLVAKLDNYYNGENSVENQKKKILEKKSKDATRKRLKRLELKKQWQTEVFDGKENNH